MKTRLSVLSNGDCVSLDDIRLVRVIDKGSLPKVEIIYRDGVIFNFDCVYLKSAEDLRNEIVAIVNEFELDIKEQKEAEKLDQINKDKAVLDSLLAPVDAKV